MSLTSSTVSRISPDKKAVMAFATPNGQGRFSRSNITPTEQTASDVDPCLNVFLPVSLSHRRREKVGPLTSTHSGPPPPPNPLISGLASTHFMLLHQ